MKCPKCHSDNPDTKPFCADCGTQLTPPDETQPCFTKTLESPIEEPSRGTLFAGRYEIIEELGKGGMGVVYRVADPLNPARRVALKSIRRKLVQPELIDRFKAEFRVLTSLQHPNVAVAYDFESLPGSEDFCFTMEFVEGRDIFRGHRRFELEADRLFTDPSVPGAFLRAQPQAHPLRH